MPVEVTKELLAELTKLQRLSELELSKPGALTPGGFHVRNKYTSALIENEAALLAAAREHLSAKAAAAFLESKGAELVLFVPQSKARHITEREIARTYDLMPEDVIAAAVDLGWVNPFTTEEQG